MRTTKPITTISFNTPEFLACKLNELTRAGRLSFWAFIVHEPEDDEGGKKQHIHLYAEPSKMLQTDDLRNELREYDPTHPTKPRGTLTWSSSRFDHWYMYVLHDKRYLASKGQSRRFAYFHDQIQTSDDDDLLAKSRSIDFLSLSPYADMLSAIDAGITWPEYFARGTVPLPQVRLFESAWQLLASQHTFRAGRPGHDDPSDDPPMVDPATGEVV